MHCGGTAFRLTQDAHSSKVTENFFQEVTSSLRDSLSLQGVSEWSAIGMAWRPTKFGERFVAVVGVARGSRCRAEAALPLAVAGLPVVVEETPSPELTAWGLQSSKVVAGAAVRLKENGRRGTLGCLVRARGEVFALTCEHVLSQNGMEGKVGAVVEWAKSSQSDWQHLGVVDELGSAGSQLTETALTDSALVKVERHVLSHKVPRIGKPVPEAMDEFEAVAIRCEVQKFGAATSLTVGRVQGIMTIRVLVRGRSGEPEAQVVYPSVLEVACAHDRFELCDAGDSGSVFWDDNGRGKLRAVGLLCSTSLGWKGYAVPMRRVLQAHSAIVFGP